MPTIRQVLQHIHQADYAFSIDLKDASLHISVARYQCFCISFGKINPSSKASQQKSFSLGDKLSLPTGQVLQV